MPSVPSLPYEVNPVIRIYLHYLHRNLKRGEINQMELELLNMERNDVNDDYAKELDVDDRTRLLEEADLSDNSEEHQTGRIDEQSNGSRSADICMIEVGGVKGGVSRQQITAERKRLSKLKSLQQSLKKSVRSSLSDVALFMW